MWDGGVGVGGPMSLSFDSTVLLNHGIRMPVLGLGVFQTPPGRATLDAVLAAFDAGYRLIDTARIYGNEADVGEAIRASDLSRDEIFVTTKLWNTDHGYDEALLAFEASRRRMGLDHVDLYLIHWPVQGARLESWKALTRLLKEGRCRAIGVSNYMVHHLDELVGAADVVPAVNQIEVSPFLQPRAAIARSKDLGIQVEAYSPLTKARRLRDATLRAVASRVGRSPAQVLLRWGLQKGFVVIPKSARPERIRENAAVFDFELSVEDMALLDGLDEGLHTGWNPEAAP